MQEEDKSQNKLEAYFELAKKEPPVISSDEIKKVIIGSPLLFSSKSKLSTLKWWIFAGVGIITVAFTIFFNQKKNKVIENYKNELPTIQNSNNSTNKTPTIEDKIFDKSDIIQNEKSINEKISKDELKIVSKANKQKNAYEYNGGANVNFIEDGKSIDLLIEDNEVKELIIDGIKILPNKYNEFESYIAKGLTLKANSDKLKNEKVTIEDRQKLKNKQIMNTLIDNLKQDQLIDTTGSFEFRLTGTSLIINGVEKESDLFEKYKNLYESISGNKLNAKSNIRIKH